ncbi:MAG: CRISPR-associated endonuclease Cas2 [Acidimicrobiales bacterium]
MDVLVAYDVSTLSREGARRLAKVASICERYGTRVQYSLFECRLDSVGLEVLKGELLDVIEPEEDAIDIYRLDRPMEDVRTSLGRKAVTPPTSSWIITPAPDLQ